MNEPAVLTKPEKLAKAEAFDPNEGRLRRIKALIRKEALQTLRDPSSMIVAIVLPALLLFLFGFGVSFDVTTVRIGLVIENPNPAADEFKQSLSNTPFFKVQVSSDRRA